MDPDSLRDRRFRKNSPPLSRMRVDGEIVFVRLPDGQEALLSLEDKELCAVKWRCNHNGYAWRKIYLGHKKTGYTTKFMFMHREVTSRMGFDSTKEVDHINRNKLDNRRSNLREADSSQNKINRPQTKLNTTGYKGVYWYNHCPTRFRAQIVARGTSIHLGIFDSKEEAASAYNQAAIEHFGEYAWLNPIEEKK